MEALLLVLDIAVLVVAFVWAIGNDGTNPVTGLFRFRDTPSREPRPASTPRPDRRAGR